MKKKFLRIFSDKTQKFDKKCVSTHKKNKINIFVFIWIQIKVSYMGHRDKVCSSFEKNILIFFNRNFLKN